MNQGLQMQPTDARVSHAKLQEATPRLMNSRLISLEVLRCTHLQWQTHEPSKCVRYTAIQW